MKKFYLALLIISLSFFFQEIQAGTDDNVSGYAWSENIGWISFNSTNTHASIDYGVNINSDGIFSGYAWSENIGWITFNESELTGCPISPCQAKLDFSTKKVSGWARACSVFQTGCSGTLNPNRGGWDGWIRLRDDNYGVSWNSTKGEMEKWAWSDMIIGWISFNCTNTDWCATSNYKVIYGGDSIPPTVSVIAEPSTVTTTWQNTDATATVSCTDAETGCDSGSYRLKSYTSNPGTCSTDYSQYDLTSPQKISSHSWVCGAARDFAGNTGFSSPVEFKVDKIAPSTAVTAPEDRSWQRDDFEATLDDSDLGGSGLTNCKYIITDMANNKTTGIKSRDCDPVNITVKVGTSTTDHCAEDRDEPVGQPSCRVSSKAFDLAGNDSGWKSRIFRIDYTPPEVGKISCATQAGEICYPGSPCTSADQGIEKSFCATLTDPVGKVDGCWLYVDDRLKKTATISPIPCENATSCSISVNYAFPESGSHTMYFKCQDAAKNIGQGEEVTVNVRVNHPPKIIDGPKYTTSPCPSPTTQPGCNVNFSVTATDEDGDVLTYTWLFGDGDSSTEQNPSHHYSATGTYSVIVTVSDGRGGTDSGGLTLTVEEPTLSVNLSADPAFGIGSLSGVKLRAIVSGTMYGTINYKFDCQNDGSWELEVSNQTTTDYTTPSLCDYPGVGIYTAKVLVERGIGNATNTTEIKVVESICTPGETTTCNSPQGCSHTIVCQEDGTWPACPTDECAKGAVRSCGFCGTQTCTDSCTWGSCVGEGVCPANTEDTTYCPCPSDKCIGADYYDYPPYGDCGPNCTCNIGTGFGQPCQPNVIINDPRCAPTLSVDLKVALDSTNWQDSLTGQAPLSGVDLKASVSGTMTGTINYKFDCQNDGVWELEINNTSTNPYQADNLCSYSTAQTYTARVFIERGTKSAEDTATIYVWSNPPTAEISCDNSACGPGSSCNPDIAYNRNCTFRYLNQSTDPDNDISRSVWSIFYQDGTPWADPWLICDDNPQTDPNEAICNLTLPSLPASKNYYLKLYVEDKSGAFSSTTRSFYVRREAISEFDCSLSVEEEKNWANCDKLNQVFGRWPYEDEIVYFRDRSLPSEGAEKIDHRSWKFKDGNPAENVDNEIYPSASFKKIDQNSGKIGLTITDSFGRTDTITHQVFPTVPLPEWKEIPPF